MFRVFRTLELKRSLSPTVSVSCVTAASEDARFDMGAISNENRDSMVSKADSGYRVNHWP